MKNCFKKLAVSLLGVFVSAQAYTGQHILSDSTAAAKWKDSSMVYYIGGHGWGENDSLWIFDTYRAFNIKDRQYQITAHEKWSNATNECVDQLSAVRTHATCYLADGRYGFVVDNVMYQDHYILGYQTKTNKKSRGGFVSPIWNPKVNVQQWVEKAKENGAFAVRFNLSYLQYKDTNDTDWTTPDIENKFIYWDYRLPARGGLYFRETTINGDTTSHESMPVSGVHMVYSRDEAMLRNEFGYADTLYQYDLLKRRCYYKEPDDQVTTKTGWQTVWSKKNYTRQDLGMASEATRLYLKSDTSFSTWYEGVLFSPTDSMVSFIARYITVRYYLTDGTPVLDTTYSNEASVIFSKLVQVKVSGYGSVSPSDFASGKTVQAGYQNFTATPDENYTFVGWYAGSDSSKVLVSTNPELSFFVQQNTSLEARFKPSELDARAWVYTHNSSTKTEVGGDTAETMFDYIVGRTSSKVSFYGDGRDETARYIISVCIGGPGNCKSDTIFTGSLWGGREWGPRIRVDESGNVWSGNLSLGNEKKLGNVNTSTNPFTVNSMAEYVGSSGKRNSKTIMFVKKWPVVFYAADGKTKIVDTAYEDMTSVYPPTDLKKIGFPDVEDGTRANYYWQSVADPTERKTIAGSGWYIVLQGDSIVYKAVAEYSYRVRFLSYDGKDLSTKFVDADSAAVAPEAPARSGYVFIGWDKSFDKVNRPLDVTAVYLKIPEINFTTSGMIGHYPTDSVKVESPSACFSVEKKTVALASAPTKPVGMMENDSLYRLTIDVKVNDTGECAASDLVLQWKAYEGKGELHATVNNKEAEGDINTAASHKNMGFTVSTEFKVRRRFLVSFVGPNDEPISADIGAVFYVWENSRVSTPFDQSTMDFLKEVFVPAPDSQFTYSFGGWTPSYAAVTHDVTYKMVLDSVRNQFEVKFYNKDSLQIGNTQKVWFSDAAKEPKVPEYEGYVFKNWTADFTDVRKNLDVYSVYLPVPQVKLTLSDTTEGKKEVSVKLPECLALKNSTLYKSNGKDKVKDAMKGGVEYVWKGDVEVDTESKDCAKNKTVKELVALKGVSGAVVPVYVNGQVANKNVAENPVEFSVAYTFTAEDVPGSSSSTAKSDSSDSSKPKSSSSKDKNDIRTIAVQPQFSLYVAGRSIQVANAHVGSKYAVLDMQGRVILQGVVHSENFDLNMNRAASYIVRIGNQMRVARIK